MFIQSLPKDFWILLLVFEIVKVKFQKNKYCYFCKGDSVWLTGMIRCSTVGWFGMPNHPWVVWCSPLMGFGDTQWGLPFDALNHSWIIWHAASLLSNLACLITPLCCAESSRWTVPNYPRGDYQIIWNLCRHLNILFILIWWQFHR